MTSLSGGPSNKHKDFQLAQALNKLKGLPVKASSTLAERKSEKKED